MKHDRQRSREKKYWPDKDYSRQKQRHRDNYKNKDRDYQRSRRDQHIHPTKQRQKNQYSQKVTQQNRNQGCPFVVKIYYCINQSNTYKKQQDLPKQRQQILYLWMTSTLRQITELLRAHMPSIRTKQKFIYSRVFVDGHRLNKQQMGTVFVQKKIGNIDSKNQTLSMMNFNIGDHIDVSIHYS